MDNRWHSKERKKQTLCSLCIGFILFLILYAATKIFKRSLCPLKSIFDISCPGCGLTRGFIAIMKLDFYAAVKYNVLSVPLFLGISVYSILAVIDVVYDKNLIAVVEKQLSKKYMYAVYAVIVVISYTINKIL